MVNESWKKILTVEKKEIDYPSSAENTYTITSYTYSAKLTVLYNFSAYPIRMKMEMFINEGKDQLWSSNIPVCTTSSAIESLVMWILLLEYIEVKYARKSQ